MSLAILGQREVGATPARRPFWAMRTEVLESRASSLSSVQTFSLVEKVPTGAVMRWTMTRGTMAVGPAVAEVVASVSLMAESPFGWLGLSSAIRHLHMSSQAFQHWQPGKAVSRNETVARSASLRAMFFISAAFRGRWGA